MKPIHTALGIGMGLLGAGWIAVGQEGDGRGRVAGLPEEIVREEEAYAAWQEEIAAELAAAGEPREGETPEELRERLAGWYAAQTERVEYQERWSAAIDRMYAAYGLSLMPPRPQKPLRPAGDGGPDRDGERVYEELAEVDARFGDGRDPEALRAAIAGWVERNRNSAALRLEGVDWRGTGRGMGGSGSSGRSAASQVAGEVRVLPGEAVERDAEREELWRMEQRRVREVLGVARPEPDADGTLPDAEACGRWRDEVAERTGEIETAAGALRLSIAGRTGNRINPTKMQTSHERAK